MIGRDHRLAHAAVLEQVVHEQAHDLQLVDEGALLVGGTGPIGVAIEQQAEVVAATGQDAQRLVDVRADGLRVDAAEARVALGWISVHLDLAAGQQARNPARTGAPHRLDENVHVGGPQPVEVDGPRRVDLIRVERVEALDHAGRLGLGERTRGRRRTGAVADRLLERGQDGRAGGRAGVGLDLEAVVGPRVVRGGDHDAARRVRSTTSYEAIWVGIGAAAMATAMSCASSTSAAACAKYSLAKRRS